MDYYVDSITSTVDEWCSMAQSQYKLIDCHVSFEWDYPTMNPYSKPTQHSNNKARLRQQALEAALAAGADYLLVSTILL